ncbi:MAG: YceI family protein [Cyclobacteriaceae bacterium]
MRKFSELLIIVFGMVGCIPLRAQVIYKLSTSSKVQISGTSTVSDWAVKSQGVSGEMTFAGSVERSAANPSPKGTIREGKAALEVATIKSEKGEAMDNKMYKALKNDAHPEITFLLTQPIQLLKVPATIPAMGTVEIAGVKRPITFDLNLTYAENAFRLQGSQSLKMSEFEIEPPTAMFGQIVTGDEIVVELDLLFKK